MELLSPEIEFSDDEGAWTNVDDNQTQESTERVSSSSDVDEISSEKNVETQESFQVSESSSEIQLKGPEQVSKRKKNQQSVHCLESFRRYTSKCLFYNNGRRK